MTLVDEAQARLSEREAKPTTRDDVVRSVAAMGIRELGEFDQTAGVWTLDTPLGVAILAPYGRAVSIST